MKSQNFTFENGLTLRLVEQLDNETAWFIAKDACEILGIADTSQAMERLDEDEKLMRKLYVSGQERDTWSVNEFGLYSLILTSNKPDAKAFKRWITHEVLPSIRKAGKFTTEQAKEHEISLQAIANSIEKLHKEKDEHQRKVNDLRKAIEEKTAEMISLIKMDRTQLRLEFPSAPH